MGLIKKLRKAKKEAPPNEKPAVVKTHLRDMIIVPEMIGSVVGIYNGKVFNSVEIKPEMTGHYLAEFSISYKPVKHGRPGIGATHCTFLLPFPKPLLIDPSFSLPIVCSNQPYIPLDTNPPPTAFLSSKRDLGPARFSFAFCTMRSTSMPLFSHDIM
ncbi:40s ribosomal protein S15 [Rhizoctonia solani AG-3 Rhs1AP]|nr:40s ribosomal protein S15 [Rhizoctonia solani AG-3 Rhs1AP]